MRESYGNTLLITVMMIFVVMMVSFTAVIVNIAKTFRVKNQIIDYVEQYKYDDKNGVSSSACIDKISDYLSNTGYQKVELDDSITCDNNYWHDKGYCISPVGTDDNKYYKVTVYVSVSLPFFGVKLKLPISGESRAPVSLN